MKTVMLRSKSPLFFIAFCSLLFGAVYTVKAQPEINSAIGTFNAGDNIVITGSSFGTKATAAPIRWEDSEAYNTGNGLSSESGWWTHRDGYSELMISEENQRPNSTKNLFADIKHDGANVNTPITYKENVGFANTGKIFVSLWVRVGWGADAQDQAAEAYQIKLHNFSSYVQSNGAAGGSATSFFLWWDPGNPGFSNTMNTSVGGTVWWGHNLMDLNNHWYNVVHVIDMGSPGIADGEFHGYLGDGNSIYNTVERLNNQFIRSDEGLLDAMKFFNYLDPNASGVTETPVYYDDVYIDNSWARVEIGDNSSYLNCTHREIQIPSAWDGVTNEITLTLNQGAFDTLEGKYLFVIDSDNNPSDGFLLGEAPADSVSITNLSPYQVLQRDDLGKADILVEGIYTGTPTNIEARWNENSTWTNLTLDANGAGTFSGTLVDQSQAQGILEARFSNNTSIADSVKNLGIGDVFIIAGQSNASGRAFTLNSYSHASLKATMFGNNDKWADLKDPVDASTDQIDIVSSEAAISEAALGSPWPLIATSIMASQNIPVAFVPTPLGATSILQWQPGANHSDASTLYGSMNRRINAVGGIAKAVLFYQGEYDAYAHTGQALYETQLNNFINTVESDFPGLKTMVGQIGHSWLKNDTVRAAQIHVSHTNKFAILGPVTYDINLADEGGDKLHFKSDADMGEFARRWYKAIEKEFYDGTNGYEPIADTANCIYIKSSNKIVVPFTDDTTPAIDPASTASMTSFDLKNNGSLVSISSIAIVDNSIELKPSKDLNTSQSITLTYGSEIDALEKAIYDKDKLPAENFYDLRLKVNDDPTGIIKSNFENNLLIYPNPTNDYFSIDLGENCKSASVKIMNLNGTLIQTNDYKETQLLNLNIESKSAGIYLLAIESGEKKALVRLIKK